MLQSCVKSVVLILSECCKCSLCGVVVVVLRDPLCGGATLRGVCVVFGCVALLLVVTLLLDILMLH